MNVKVSAGVQGVSEAFVVQMRRVSMQELNRCVAACGAQLLLSLLR